MLVIDVPARTIPKREFFDNSTQTFIEIAEQYIEPIHLQLEHSLMSVSKWESKWHEPFFDNKQLSGEKMLDYVRCMTINPQKNPKVYELLPEDKVLEIVEYMEDPSSAWVISPKKKGRKSKSKAYTVELIYYNMIQLGIPMECEKWHLNRLMALMDFCDEKGGSAPGGGGGGPAKQSRREILEMYRAINERNRKTYNSKG